MESPRDDRYPEHSVGREFIQKGVEAAIASIPLAGNALAVGFAHGMMIPLELRRNDWFNLLAERISNLEDEFEELRSENLFDNDEFVSAAVMASQAALATHQQEMREALANAAINAALPGAPDADTQNIYLRLIERLTPSHLRLLVFLNDPAGWFKRNEISRPDVRRATVEESLLRALPELRDRSDFVDQLTHDLSAERLLRASRGIYATYDRDELWGSFSSEWGRGFLRFVGDPPSAN